MIQTAGLRRLEIGTTYNLRDVGGYALAAGGRTAWGRLFRSDLPRLTPADAFAVRGLGLRTVLDLRGDSECATHPSSVAGVEVQLVRRPLPLEALIDELVPEGDDVLGALYRAGASRLGSEIAAAVGALCRPDALPALVHCAAGKDRTGVVVALMLSAVGVPDDLVAADFALSSTYLSAGYFADATARSTGRHRTNIDPGALRGSEPRSILALLAEIRDQHGGARDYLRHHGLAATDLDTLRDALVDQTDPPDRVTPEERA